ncbi:MBOAT family O-acyltransferase [Aquimarina aquimarini]|uniref:MBOAT family O-acyltransferase n=1 Tax=Aquimarina aquimarini TaxID=1191734 RepID=UPI00131F2201|nr:MBOAT family O-acyltransferase [Aquimarina aquimarini]
MQNIFLLIISLLFYAFADWRFLALLGVTTFVNYYLGIKIYKVPQERKKTIFLYIGILFNLGMLVYFKYFNFFYESFFDLLSLFGVASSHSILVILLPLGISFFTFQVLGYLVDVYNEEIEPNTDLLEFSVFVAFFPKILSGPIERAASFIPQIQKKRKFSYKVCVDGLRQILWGLFAKVVIAENCAEFTNRIFDQYTDQSGSLLLIGAFFYAIQLYADFSGYSNMAIGVSKLFGIQLMRNFSTPFFATNISDFWRRWHISLTTWMLDYVFTPLSFVLRKYQKTGVLLAIVITFILVGFWHGANWTFIVYGLLHGLYFIPLVYSQKMNVKQKVAQGKRLPSIKETIQMLALFILIMLTDIFFRAKDVTTALDHLKTIFSASIFDFPAEIYGNITIITLTLIGVFMIVEWINRERKHDFDIANCKGYIRWGSYISIFILIFFFGRSSETFIYFQF